MFRAERTYRITIQWEYATMNDATMNECYNEWCYSEQFLSTKSGCYNKHRRYNKCGGILSANIECTCTCVSSSLSFVKWTNALQLMKLPQDSHPRWVGTMTALLPPLCNFFMIFIGESLFLVFTKERLFMFLLGKVCS